MRLSPQKTRVLLALLDGKSLHTLTGMAYCQRAGLSRTIDALMSDGLIVGSATSIWDFSLTPTGRSVAEDLRVER